MAYVIFGKIYSVYQQDKTKEEVNTYLNNPSSYTDDKFIIEIPKVNISNIVVRANKGFSNLKNNLVYYNNADPKNKIIIFGHSGMGSGTYFNRLDELKTGDNILLINNKSSFLYLIEDIYHVSENDVSILKEEKNKKKIVLVTCLKKEKDKRLVIIGSQKSKKPLKIS